MCTRGQGGEAGEDGRQRGGGEAGWTSVWRQVEGLVSTIGKLQDKSSI